MTQPIHMSTSSISGLRLGASFPAVFCSGKSRRSENRNRPKRCVALRSSALHYGKAIPQSKSSGKSFPCDVSCAFFQLPAIVPGALVKVNFKVTAVIDENDGLPPSDLTMENAVIRAMIIKLGQVRLPFSAYRTDHR